MTDQSQPRAVSLADIRDQALVLLDRYEESAGISPADDYDDVPRVHPMAEAKFMLACVELAESGAMSRVVTRRRVCASLDRLREMNVSEDSGTASWGLGFPYRNLPASEPFAITTAMVLSALHRAEHAPWHGRAGRHLLAPLRDLPG